MSEKTAYSSVFLMSSLLFMKDSSCECMLFSPLACSLLKITLCSEESKIVSADREALRSRKHREQGAAAPAL